MKIKMALRSVLKEFLGFGGEVNYKDNVPNKQCKEFEINNWITSEFVIRKLVPIVGVHPFPVNEQMLMVSAVCRLKPTHIFEWGTNIGNSARIFFEICKAFNIDTEIHSIDLPDDVEHCEHPKEMCGMMVKGKKGVQLHRGDGLETSLSIISRLRDSSAIRPLFFVDGDHSHASVKRELEGIINEVPQASVILHDTFYQSAESGYNIGPYNAIEDVLKNTPSQFKIFSQKLGLPGMTFLWNCHEGRLP